MTKDPRVPNAEKPGQEPSKGEDIPRPTRKQILKKTPVPVKAPKDD